MSQINLGSIMMQLGFNLPGLQSNISAAQNQIRGLGQWAQANPVNVNLQLNPTSNLLGAVQTQQRAAQAWAQANPVVVPVQGGGAGGAGGGRGGFGGGRGFGRVGYRIASIGIRSLEQEFALYDRIEKSAEGENTYSKAEKAAEEYRDAHQGLTVGHLARFLNLGTSQTSANSGVNFVDQEQQELDEAAAAAKRADRGDRSAKLDTQVREDTKRLNEQASESGASQSEKALLDIAKDRRKFEEDYAKELKAATGGVATPALLAQRVAFDRFESDRQLEASRRQEERSRPIRAKIAELNATLAGDPEASALVAFNENQSAEQERIRQQLGQGDADDYRNNVAPKERAEFDIKQARERAKAEADLDRKISDIQGQASEDTQRASGDTRGADISEFKRNMNDRILALREAADATSVLVDKTRLLAEEDAQESAATERIAAKEAERTQKIKVRGAEIDAQRDAANLRGQGRDNEASDAEFEAKWAAIAKEAGRTGDPQFDRLNQQYLAEKRQRAFGRQSELQSEGLDTFRANARAAGQGAVGDEEAIREDIRKRQEAAGDDPAAQKAAREYGEAKLREFLAGNRPRSQTFTDAREFDRQLQQGIFDSSGGGRALGNQKGAADLATLLSGGKIASDLGDAGKKMSDAADKLLDAAKALGQNPLVPLGLNGPG